MNEIVSPQRATPRSDLAIAQAARLVPIREVRLSAGAGFVVALCGDIMALPGLPRAPAANAITVGPDGRIAGLF